MVILYAYQNFILKILPIKFQMLEKILFEVLDLMSLFVWLDIFEGELASGIAVEVDSLSIMLNLKLLEIASLPGSLTTTILNEGKERCELGIIAIN